MNSNENIKMQTILENLCWTFTKARKKRERERSAQIMYYE